MAKPVPIISRLIDGLPIQGIICAGIAVLMVIWVVVYFIRKTS